MNPQFRVTTSPRIGLPGTALVVRPEEDWLKGPHLSDLCLALGFPLSARAFRRRRRVRHQ